MLALFSLEDVELIGAAGGGRVDFTVGSALDVFGGDLAYSSILEWHREENPCQNS